MNSLLVGKHREPPSLGVQRLETNSAASFGGRCNSFVLEHLLSLCVPVFLPKDEE